MEKIDFVITWLDSNDKKWIKEINKYSEKKIDESRYRDWGFLKYWFRAIEENAPWVNKIYFITFGHIPKWLNTNNSKLVIVNHKDYISSEYLPTFNSCVLEINLLNIKGLSEKFVYFNDDAFLNSEVEPKDFFVHGKPLNSKVLSKNYFYGKTSTKISYNCGKIVNKYFKIESERKKYNIKDMLKMLLSLPKLPINGLESIHIPTPYLKKTFKNVWEKEKDYLLKICNNKFRTEQDVSQWLFEYWQIASKNYVERPTKDYKYYDIKKENLEEICSVLKNKTYKFICLNDGETTYDFEECKKRITKSLKERYQNKSSFEK